LPKFLKNIFYGDIFRKFREKIPLLEQFNISKTGFIEQET